MKFAKAVLAVAALLAAFEAPQTVEAKSMSRQDIKQMPITARPSRPGHFYGNTVRRAQTRRTTR